MPAGSRATMVLGLKEYLLHDRLYDDHQSGSIKYVLYTHALTAPKVAQRATRPAAAVDDAQPQPQPLTSE
jgi:hypothetical protein